MPKNEKLFNIIHPLSIQVSICLKFPNLFCWTQNPDSLYIAIMINRLRLLIY